LCGECLCGAAGTLARLCRNFETQDLPQPPAKLVVALIGLLVVRVGGQEYPPHTTRTHLLTRQSRRFLKDLHKHFPRELSRLRVLV
jgi:hypothetical protein